MAFGIPTSPTAPPVVPFPVQRPPLSGAGDPPSLPDISEARNRRQEILLLASGLIQSPFGLPLLTQTHLQQRREAALKTILEGVGEKDQERLKGELSAVDPALLEALAKAGLKGRVIGDGEKLGSLLTPRTLKEVDDNLTQDAKALQPFGNELDGLDATPLPGNVGLEEGAEATRKRQQAATAVRERIGKATGDRYTLYHPLEDQDDSKIPPALRAQAAAMRAAMPRSTIDIAKEHGCTTPEEIAQFNRLVEAANGDRLKAMRARMLERLEKDGLSPELKEKYRKNPSLIPIDASKEGLIVPDRYKSGETWLNGHDRETQLSWGKKFEGSGVLGQEFSNQGKLVFLIRREDKSEGTALHELGHSVEHAYEKKDPARYREFQERLNKLHQKSKRDQNTVYGHSNPGEYFAEGFRLYHQNPEALKKANPGLFALVQEAIEAVSRR